MSNLKVHIILPVPATLHDNDLLQGVKMDVLALQTKIKSIYGVDTLVHESEEEFERTKNPLFGQEVPNYGEPLKPHPERAAEALHIPGPIPVYFGD